MNRIITKISNNTGVIATCKSYAKGKKGFVSSIYVDIPYRKNNIGSEILKTTESSLKAIYKIDEINILAWQPQGCSNLTSFLKKHNYRIIPEKKSNYHDDGEKVYDLIKFIKKL